MTIELGVRGYCWSIQTEYGYPFEYEVVYEY